MILRYEIIYGIVDYILHHPEETYDDYIDFAGSFGFSEATSKFWIDLFLDTICKYLVVESTVDNARGWLIKQVDSGISIDGLCDRLVAMLSATWEQDEEVIVTKNGKVYRKIQKFNVEDLTEYINRLKDEIQDIQTQLDEQFKLKDTPDQETLDYWNNMMTESPYRIELLDKLEEKTALLEQAQSMLNG